MKDETIILYFLLLVQVIGAKDIVYVLRDKLDDCNNNLFNKADLTKRLCIWNEYWEPNMWFLTKKLLEKKSNYELRTTSTNDKSILFNELRKAKLVIDNTVNLSFSYNLDPVLYKWLLDKMLIVIFEPPVVMPGLWMDSFHNRVKRVFMCNDSYVEKNPRKYSLLRYPFYSGVKNIEVVPFGQKKLCCAINGNKRSVHPQSLYAKRLEDALIWGNKYFEDFDFYGIGFADTCCKAYRGGIPGDQKIEYLRKYRFCLSYENMHNGYGWVTERMFNCLEAGCVPVYLGSVNIDKFVPRDCYIDRAKFATNEDLYFFLKNMTEEQYNVYIKNIEDYLSSNLPDEFGYERFAEYIVAGLLK